MLQARFFSYFTRFSEVLRFALPAILALVLQVQFYGPAHPPPWPDEALFSNPAGELARGQGFRTVVLDGLVPGMEEATLWNSPLYMVLLSGLYSFTGESLEAGRALSLMIGIIILVSLARILQELQVDRSVLFIAPLIVALDPSFVRGANVIRMDGLCLLFCLLALRYSLKSFQSRRDHYSFLSGVFLGLGASSHPAALYGVSFVVLFHLFRWRGLFFAFCGVLLSMSPWLAYIVQHLDIFELQFLPQLMRKSGLLSLWGGPTGGILVVFTSQYGGGATSMLLVALLSLVASILLAALWWHRWKLASGKPVSEIADMPEANEANEVRAKLRTGPVVGLMNLFRSDSLFLLSLSWPLVTAFCLLSVEGWYAMHSFPYLVLSISAFFSVPYRQTTVRRSAGWLLRVVGVGLFLIGVVNAHRHMVRDKDGIVQRALHTMTVATEGCESVFARMVPDPYFSILKARPQTRYYEFVPARLSFPSESVNPVQRYDTVDCFLLEGSGLQTGEVDAYLSQSKDDFERIPLIFSQPANSGHLYRRKPEP